MLGAAEEEDDEEEDAATGDYDSIRRLFPETW